MNKKKGQAVVEFVLTLPFICAGIGLFILLAAFFIKAQVKAHDVFMEERSEYLFSMQNKAEDGQTTIFIVMIVPVLIIIFMFVIDFGLLVDSKLRLQIALDRGLFAGSARLAHIMNDIALENRTIFESFLKVDKNAADSSWQSGECQNRVNELKNRQDAGLENIDRMISAGYNEAHAVAEAVALANYKYAEYAPLFGMPGTPLFQIVMGGRPTSDGKDQIDESSETGELIRKNIVCGNISGLVFDPSDVKATENPNILKYIYQNGESVGIAAELGANFTPPLAGRMFGGSRIKAISAARPYGGSIKDFALLGGDHLFKPALVPAESIVNEEGN